MFNCVYLIFAICFILRILFLKSSEQSSLKKRNFFKFKEPRLIFGNNGFFINKFIRFEFFYFLLFKNFIKTIYQTKYCSVNYKKYWYFITGNYPCRKKSKNARMGKGIGMFLTWVFLLPCNFVFFEFIYFFSKKTIYFLKIFKFKISKDLYLIQK